MKKIEKKSTFPRPSKTREMRCKSENKNKKSTRWFCTTQGKDHKIPL